MRVLLETDNAIVGFDEPRKAMVVLWAGIAEREEFYAVNNCVLKGFKIFFANTLVIDLERFGKMGKHNLNYLVKHVLPMTIKCGLKKLILINMIPEEEEEMVCFIKDSLGIAAGKIAIESGHSFDEAFAKLAV